MSRELRWKTDVGVYVVVRVCDQYPKTYILNMYMEGFYQDEENK